MNRIENGILIELTPEEEAEIQTYWDEGAKQNQILHLRNQILALKTKLQNTDYKVIKSTELGIPLDDDFKNMRAAWRIEINDLQNQLVLLDI